MRRVSLKRVVRCDSGGFLRVQPNVVSPFAPLSCGP
jgi:hypothetical protein